MFAMVEFYNIQMNFQFCYETTSQRTFTTSEEMGLLYIGSSPIGKAFRVLLLVTNDLLSQIMLLWEW